MLELQQWTWSSCRSYALGEEGIVQLNQWPKSLDESARRRLKDLAAESFDSHPFAESAKGWATRPTTMSDVERAKQHVVSARESDCFVGTLSPAAGWCGR